ncbi:SCO4225 family membrane protein [Streptomyces sp. NPDC087844]|uniref:SCO4225 family membrane protein n=1 Tax=Streptomyces sp. NPDC087844 TaxID=3365805 RepID=UPI00380659A7
MTVTGKSPGSGPTALARRLGRPLKDVFALVYLAVCAGLVVWAYVVSASDGSDGSMAGVIPLLATAPASFVPLMLLPEGAAMFVLAIVLGALANALFIGWCARALRRGRGHYDSTS